MLDDRTESEGREEAEPAEAPDQAERPRLDLRGRARDEALIVYFDTSALVATYVADACSAKAMRARRAADGVATSLLAYAETLAAFGSLQRSGKVTPSARRLVESRFLADWKEFRHVRLEGRLLPHIRRVLAAHPLKGADSVHLASACVVARACANAGIECSFACDDRPLAAAALAEGLALAW